MGGAGLSATQGGRIDVGALTSPSGLTLTVDSSSGFPTDQITSLTNSNLDVTGGAPDFSALSDIDGSNITISGGAIFDAPMVAAYSGSSTTLEATGTGSVLELPRLASVTGSYLTFEAVGAGSTLDLPKVTTPSKTTVTADNGGAVALAAGTIALPAPPLTGAITIPELPQGVTVNLASTATFTQDMTFDVAQGDTVNITGGTFAGGMTFDVAQGATINLGDEFAAVVVSGRLTGSGGGTVAVVNSLEIGVGGATLDFSGSMFQWTGGAISGVGGVLTNLWTAEPVQGLSGREKAIPQRRHAR